MQADSGTPKSGVAPSIGQDTRRVQSQSLASPVNGWQVEGDTYIRP